jgi:ribosome-associated toxin RatA of RatAB toxin-antitoxin module
MLFLVQPGRHPYPGPMRLLTRLVLLAALCAPAARAADDVSVEARRRGEALEVDCRATLSASLDLVWQTLTDYNRLAEFIPGMRKSRVIATRPEGTVVEQAGEAKFLFLTFPIDAVLVATERPPYGIDVRMEKGSLKRMEGGYRIAPQADGRLVLSWSGIIEAASAPPLFGEFLMRASIEDQFRGMVREIERRDAVRRAREAGAKP